MPVCEAAEQCVEECNRGDAHHCLAAGYAYYEAGDSRFAQTLYRRACLLGLANGCTNYGANLWVHEHTEGATTCARKLFAAACSASEHFGCGMIGRVDFERAETSDAYARVRRQLEDTCSEVSGFSCRVLAKQLESGRLGTYDQNAISDLLTRACEGGDTGACDAPPTAEETFR